MASQSSPIAVAPAPWVLKGTIYSFMMYISSSDARKLENEKDFLYAPLEAKSDFAKGKLVGGLGMVQVLRYSESPVGPYDELVMCAGNIEYEAETVGKDGQKQREKKRNLRVTRAYVSQENTCYNGRKNWNIPKHLARFQFKDLADGGVSITIFPFEANAQGVEATPNGIPFFEAVYKPMKYTPSFSASTGWAKYVGLDLSLVTPPLPEGKGEKGELAGTDEWSEVLPSEYSKKTTLGWWDLKQGGELGEESALFGENGNETRDRPGTHENWWPGLGRWRIGLKMEDAEIVFPEGRKWIEYS